MLINGCYNFKISGSDPYYLVRKPWSCRLLTEILRIKTHKTIILTAVYVVVKHSIALLGMITNCMVLYEMTGIFWTGGYEIRMNLQLVIVIYTDLSVRTGSQMKKVTMIRFQVLTAASMKMAVLWNVVRCSLSPSSPWWWRQQTPLKRR
jgi:hypothetical protein